MGIGNRICEQTLFVQNLMDSTVMVEVRGAEDGNGETEAIDITECLISISYYSK